MASPASALPVLPEELLEEIFLGLDDAADLARTSAACTSFRRAVSARRFRSLHSPPVLGFLDCDASEGVFRFIPFELPHRSAPAARALARAADFTFSFLPGPCSWRLRDSRDGRVLLSRRVANATALDDLVVCDPLHRRYVRIPPIPNDLTASIPRLGTNEPFLAPAGEDEDDKLKEESSFTVICTVWFANKFMPFFFSSANQKWRVIPSHCSSYFGGRRFYAHGCFFWVVDSMRYALMLDTREMKFSTIDLPPKGDSLFSAAIVEAGEGRVGFLAISDWHNRPLVQDLAKQWCQCRRVAALQDDSFAQRL